MATNEKKMPKCKFYYAIHRAQTQNMHAGINFGRPWNSSHLLLLPQLNGIY
jgi:hypothetical protein